jgi:DNA modification methylase
MIKILQGNCIDKIKELDDNSIDCVVSSPPYFGLRDYGVGGQFGLEKTYHDYLANTVKVFETFKPKLKDTATIWWNVGDSYSSGLRKSTTNQSLRGGKDYGVTRTPVQNGIKEKDLLMIPNRVAIALQDAGWYIRSEIIWHKPNPMPESVRDRPTSCHEKIWLITKSKKYYYDADAIREPLASTSLTRLNQPNLKNQKGSTRANGGMRSNGNMKAVFSKPKLKKKSCLDPIYQDGKKIIFTRPKLPSQKVFVDFMRSKIKMKDLVEATNLPINTVSHWFRYDNTGFSYPTPEDWKISREYLDDWTDDFIKMDEAITYIKPHYPPQWRTPKEIKQNPLGKNKRNVWTVTTKPFKDAHFATFPKDLIEPCIKAGCPEGGVVLDPFGGSGTTGIVAALNNRNAILIELNQNYIDIANKRIDKEVGLFNG